MAASAGVLSGSTALTIMEQIQLATLPSDQGLNTSLLSKTSPFLRVLQEKAKRESGSPIRVQLRHNRNNTQWYTGYDTLGGSGDRTGPTNTDSNVGAAGTNQWGQAVYQWRNLAVTVSISEDQLVENANMNIADLLGRTSMESLPERDRHTIFNIFGKEVELAFEDSSDALATGLMNREGDADSSHRVSATATGDDGQGAAINSIFDILSSSVTCGGLSGSALGNFTQQGLLSAYRDAAEGAGATTTPKWAARTLDLDVDSEAAGYNDGDLTRKVLGLALHDTAQGGTDSVDYIFVNPKVYVALEQDLQGDVRRDEYMTDLGFRQNMQWGAFGTTIMADPYMPLEDVVGINTNHTWLAIHPALDQEFSGFKTHPNKAAIEGQLKVKLQLVCDDRAKNFWIHGATKYNNLGI